MNVLLTAPLWQASTQLKLRREKSDVARSASANSLTALPRQLARTARSEPLALWRGTQASLLLVAAPALNFALYDALKRVLRR